MKIRILPLLLVVPAIFPAHAGENRYDVLAKTLAPFTALFSTARDKGNHALTAEITLVELTGLPAELARTKAFFAFAPPDKLCIRLNAYDEPYAIYRCGQVIQALPGSKISPILKLLSTVPDSKPKARLADFALPLPEKELVFLPALFQVADADGTAVNGVACRVIDVTLMPELARSLNATGWSARISIDAQYKPVRIEISGPQWHTILIIDALDFFPVLPAETWKPIPGETDFIKLDAGQVWRIMEAMGKVTGVPPP